MAQKKNIKTEFSSILLKWNREKNKRQMPWKGEKDPYKIWLSEIILQQTRVEQGLEYYRRFIKTFPNIHKLAKASDEKVFKMWEGLGYYSRCKNLLVTARYISRQLNGKFPNSFEEIKALKGIGTYTASAIASFAFDLPYAVVDGNVFRVLSRVFGINIPIDSTGGKNFFSHLAAELIDKRTPGIYNQAIMDFGAIVCKPATPLCDECPFKKSCHAFLNKKVNILPVKEKKIRIRQRWFYYLLIRYKDKILIHQRKEKDIWQHLFEFSLIETKTKQSEKQILIDAEKKQFLKKGNYEVISVSSLYKQKLSHQLITGQFLTIRMTRKSIVNNDGFWVEQQKIKRYAFPQFINQYLQSIA